MTSRASAVRTTVLVLIGLWGVSMLWPDAPPPDPRTWIPGRHPMSVRVEPPPPAPQEAPARPPVRLRQVPAYTVARRIADPGSTRIQVVVPSFSRRTSEDTLKAAAAEIGRREGAPHVLLYATEDARQAHTSLSLTKPQAEALTSGYLGESRDGWFTRPAP